ncbi:hypothetical protein FGL98_12680 [Leekyejoonella antrihumi]|uniref:Uncharacterized protein n=1 Tax=Leekyejoonella antrihumi TaxID=1660198 RepID=A0A563DZH4_9MICO|nr:hypothetical protein FGL98_12680 [Leekyejoonella antrihumi]
MLPLRDAVIVGICLEVVTWTVLVTRLASAVRCYREARRRGVSGWMALERGTARIMPARLARLMVYEPRMWICLTRWLTGQRPARAPGRAAYHHEKTLLFATLAGLLGFESLLTHLLLLAIVGNTWWVWALFAIDVYTLAWILGFYASLVVLPHQLDATTLRLRYGYLSEVIIPRSAIRGVRPARRPENTKGKLVTNPDGGAGYYTSGPASIAIDLDPQARLTYRGLPVTEPIRTIYLTADDATTVAASWRAATAQSPAS